MRTVTIVYDENEEGLETVKITDDEGHFVDVTFLNDDVALLVSQLHGDETPVAGSQHPADAEAQALFLLGIPVER